MILDNYGIILVSNFIATFNYNMAIQNITNNLRRIEMKLGTTIRIFRIANNYSSKELANMAGISTSHILMIENLHRHPSYSTLDEIANALNVTPEDITKMSNLSEENNWDYKKTLFEVLKIYMDE